MIYGFKHRLLGGHVHIDVFAGYSDHSLGKAGTLVMREDEWKKFKALISAGESVIGGVVGTQVRFVELEDR